MKLFFKNRVFAALSLSRIFNTTGASIFNLVFIVFASSMPLPKMAIAIANFIVLVPTFVTVLIGIKADHTQHKTRWLISIGYLQAAIFVIVAFLTKTSSYLAFSTVCLMNILSDCLSDYRGGLQMPILQHNVQQEDLMAAYSFTQALSYLSNLGGQALGVWLLTISQQNFFFVALINALAFLLSSTVLYLSRSRLTHPEVQLSEEKVSLKKQLLETFSNAKVIFEEDGHNHFLKMMGQILIINGIFGSLAAIYNLFLLDHPIAGLSFSQSILVIDVAMVAGVLLSSFIPSDFIARLDLKHLIQLLAFESILLGAVNLLQLSYVITIFILFATGYVVGKLNPKVNSMLMSQLKPEVLAQTSSFISMLVTLSMPLGTMLFTSLALWNMTATWLVFSLFGLLCLVLGFHRKEAMRSLSR